MERLGGLLVAALAVALTLPAAAPAAARQPVDRTSPPAPHTSPAFATTRVHTSAGTGSVLLPAAALPYSYWVDRRLADRFGLRAVIDALSQWDGVAGSRWATRYLGLADPAHATAAHDGHSVVFLADACPDGVGGQVHRHGTSAGRQTVYGQVALYVSEVDIGVCPVVSDAAGLRVVLAHEVGHALGLDHLCDPGEKCWREGMGPGPHRCRVMAAHLGDCFRGVEPRDHDAARHLYPTLARLSGPTRIETAARASYASFGQRAARTVVVARADGTAHGPLSAAALAAVLDAPLLLGVPAAPACVTGTTAAELDRVTATFAQVILVGDWPSSCRVALLLRGYTAERIGGAGPTALGVAVADRLAGSGRMGDVAVIVSAVADAAGTVADGIAGGAAAGTARGPVLYTGPRRLDGAVADWLRRNPAIRRAYLLGGTAALSEQVVADLRAAGLEVTRVAGPGRVETSLALADRGELFGSARAAIITAAGSWADAATGSSLGGRLGAPVVLTPPQPDPAVERWLAARRPAGGYVVGGSAAVPVEVQWRYSTAAGSSGRP